jgi:hypothetical protein
LTRGFIGYQRRISGKGPPIPATILGERNNTARSRVRVVHRGVRHARSEGGEGAAGAARDMSKARKWLEAIGLTQYAGAFEANYLDIDLLGKLTTKC